MSMSEEEELRRRKYEEDLEVKSLKRIISAYLNYPEAAEDDVKRYERSFRRLPQAHKALLPHLPVKYQKLRRCISKNTFFIFEMLKAFEPPVDMSQDDESCKHLENGSCGHLHLEDRDPCCESASVSGRTHSTKSDKACCGHEEKNEDCCEPESGNVTVGSECKTNTYIGFCNNAADVKDQECFNSITDSNKDISSESPDRLESMPHFHVPLVDVDKVRCVIRNIVRDWAAEGQKERDQCYKPILEELERHFPDRNKESPPTCLVPGAGLGRLALEISCLGFVSQGNEFSYYMMICSSFILNQTQTVGEWTIYPWIHSNCNSLSDADQLRAVPVPDIHPARALAWSSQATPLFLEHNKLRYIALGACCSLISGKRRVCIGALQQEVDVLAVIGKESTSSCAGITEGFSMCGGDFVEVYSDPSQVGAWDAVVTCFFLDTAHNIVEYIEIISRILKNGGVWINLGPLLYHFADMYGQEDEMSVELSLEDVKRIANHYGFQLELEKTIETTYTTNTRAMMQNHYFSAFWTMRKKPLATSSVQENMDE